MLTKYYTQNGWNRIINETDIVLIEKYLEIFPNLTYVGSGGSCITFASDNIKYNDLIIKVCIKQNDNVTKDAETFVKFSDLLKENNIKILPPHEILFENQKFFIYTQSKCRPLSHSKIIQSHIIKILGIFKNLLHGKIQISDMFIKNFGIYKNDIHLYDYHSNNFFYSDDRYYINHIAHYFELYYNTNLYGSNDVFDTLKLIDANFGANIFPYDVYKMLECLYNYKFDDAIILLKNIINTYKSEIKCSYNEYQYIDINSRFELSVRNHTLYKLQTVQQLIKYTDLSKFSVMDYGCCNGGIGLSIAQQFPNSNVHMSNICTKELDICNEIKDKCVLSNVTIHNMNVVNDINSYDICLYFAILHHVLNYKTMDEIINMVLKQSKKYAIIELPFGNDLLLKNVKNQNEKNKDLEQYNKSYYYLETTEQFISKITPFFNIIEYGKIDYNTQNLNRYFFSLVKK
jgi:hypothetical protein